MNCRVANWLIWGLIFISPHLQAQMPPPPSSAGETDYTIGAQTSAYLYQEPGVMQLDGNKIGISGTVVRRGEMDAVVAVEARLAYGKVNYSSVNTGNDTGEPDYLHELRFLIGKHFGSPTFSATPYIGAGWRHLVNDSSGMITTTGATGYTRISDYLYIPIGINLLHALHEGSYVQAQVEFDLFLRGNQTSKLYCGTVINRQNKGRGIRASVLIGVGPWAIGPFIQTWEIEDSNLGGPCGTIPNTLQPAFWIEPENETTEAGLSIRYTFH